MLLVTDSRVFPCEDMGAGLYAASKDIAISDLITTVTPERIGEDRKREDGKRWAIKGDTSDTVAVALHLLSLPVSSGGGGDGGGAGG